MYNFEDFETAIMLSDNLEEMQHVYEESGILDDPEQLDLHIKSIKEVLSETVAMGRMQIKILDFLNLHREQPQSAVSIMQEIGVHEHEYTRISNILS